MLKLKEVKIGIMGLGYVGLPLALAFSKYFIVNAFDINKNRILELKNNYDNTGEINNSNLKKSSNVIYTNHLNDLSKCNFYIITVPTPIKKNKNPDLKYLIKATKDVSTLIKKGDYVIYESTVYPGATEEVCVPIIEKISQLTLNLDFYVGYSPERINPGDKKHRIKDIKKITSGSSKKASIFIDKIYKKIITAGTHRTSSIMEAEAAKIIENTQRDLNIALINEFAIILNKLNIDTKATISAASTKWNFMPYMPGLVGGHCIGIDPYYLTYKSKQLGYNPKVILAGRNINQSMPSYVAKKMYDELKHIKTDNKRSKIQIMGITFKENCPDIRNSKVVDLINDLKSKKMKVDIYDPYANEKLVKNEYNLVLKTKLNKKFYDGIIIAVPHDKFLKMGIENIKRLVKKNSIIYDLKSIFKKEETDLRL